MLKTVINLCKTISKLLIKNLFIFYGDKFKTYRRFITQPFHRIFLGLTGVEQVFYPISTGPITTTI